MTAEVVAEPEVDHFEVGESGEAAEAGGGVFGEMSGVGRLLADDLEGAMASQNPEASAEADGVGSWQEEQAAGRSRNTTQGRMRAGAL